MFAKSALLALAAVAALGATSLTTSTSAEAKGFHGGGGFRGGHVSSARFVGGHGGRHIGHRVHIGHRHVHWHGHRHWRYRYYVPSPVIYGAAPVAAVYAAKPVVNRCTCLTKEYTPEGAVLFKDICTNEAAINPPAPQQTGMVAPQTAPQAQ